MAATSETTATRRPRRASGEGTKPRQVRPGLWRSDIMLGYRADGRADRRSVYGRTQREVLAQLAELRRRKDRRALPDAHRLTLGEFLRYWLDTSGIEGRKPTSVRKYAAIV